MDILDRLRDPEQGLTSSDRYHLRKDAAAEIERLLAVLADVRSLVHNLPRSATADRIDQIVAATLGDK